MSTTAQYLLTIMLVPCVPTKEFSNKALAETIQTNPHLFKLNCKINVDHLVQLLQHHPNQPFVLSMCCSLCKGSGHEQTPKSSPTPKPGIFLIIPPSIKIILTLLTLKLKLKFAWDAIQKLLGLNSCQACTYSSSVHAMDKPGTITFQLINDQSAGEFSPNLMINCEDIVGTCMDSIKLLGASLHAFYKTNGEGVELVM